MVYILELSTPLHHAKFYVGYCGDSQLNQRLAQHRAGTGAKFTRACMERGINLTLVAKFPGRGRDYERQLKRMKSTPRFVANLRKHNSEFLVKEKP